MLLRIEQNIAFLLYSINNCSSKHACMKTKCLRIIDYRIIHSECFVDSKNELFKSRRLSQQIKNNDKSPRDRSTVAICVRYNRDSDLELQLPRPIKKANLFPSF